MLFDLGPKDEKEQLFNRDKEIAEMLHLIQTGNWIAVLGPRMTGKTSLVKVALSEIEKKNYETVYLNLRGVTSLHALLEHLTETINTKQSTVARLKKLFTNIRSIHVGPDGLTIERSSHPKGTLLSLFGALNHTGKKYAIALDEAQELAPVSGQLLTLLANVFTSYNNIRFVFTGSQIGLIKYLIEPPNSDSPLYGRPPAEIHLKPFSSEVSEAFILSGLKECGSALTSDQLEGAISRLDGIVGWLTMFGNFYGIRKLGYDKALKETLKQGSKISLGELDNFLKGRSRSTYMAVLKTAKIAGSSGSSWSELKAGAEIRLKRTINNKTLTNSINALLDAEIFEDFEGKYRILDPLLSEAL